jgi:hypothetical protein
MSVNRRAYCSSNDQNISCKDFRFDFSLLQIKIVCDHIYIFMVVVAAAET